MGYEQLFASFLLDEQQGLEIALYAEQVTEATSVQGQIMPLPGAVDFLEGVMNLRNQTIPVINLKKRLGLPAVEYGKDAKVAVVTLYDQQLGLLMDDIRDVFRISGEDITPVASALQTEDRIISSILHMERGKRVAELLDLKKLFFRGTEDLENNGLAGSERELEQRQIVWSRFVIFTCNGQEYGVPVECTQEITFLTEIDTMFRSGFLEGALNLRGKTIPVMNSAHLLFQDESYLQESETNRVLVLVSEECSFGLVVEEIREILSIPEHDILNLPNGQNDNLLGLYGREDGSSVMLLNMRNLVSHQLDDIKSMSRLKNGNGGEDGISSRTSASTHHLITENCYLVFSIDKHFAIELKDVHEIIETSGVMTVPGAFGYRKGVINLRGEVVPVVDLRRFYGFEDSVGENNEKRLIICSGNQQTVALEVDQVDTIYKQENFHSTPSLNPKLADKKDTLDRLIEFENSSGPIEHVLVVNTHSLIRNHLLIGNEQEGSNQENA